MAIRIITSKELQDLSIPKSKRGKGYDEEFVNSLVKVTYETVSEMEKQIGDLQSALASARADSAPLDVTNSTTHGDEQAIANWLTTLSPLDISAEAQKAIAQTIVESTLAASHIRTEAKQRASQLFNAIASEVASLTVRLTKAKESYVGINEIPAVVDQWEKEFAQKISTLLSQLELPWTVQVSELSTLLSKIATQTNSSKVLPPEQPDNKKSPEQTPWQS